MAMRSKTPLQRGFFMDLALIKLVKIKR